jgi:arylsulfatase
MRLSALAAALGLAACASKPAPDKLAIVIVLDASAAPYFSVYGDPNDTSPRLAALAADGVVFDHASSASATTGPSTGAMLTSMPVAAFLQRNDPNLPAHATTIGEALLAHGVATWAALANPNAGGASRGYERGYQTVERAYRGKAFDDAEGLAFPTPDDVLKPTIARIDADGPGPTFLYAHFLQPHSPYSAPAELIRRFGADPARPWPELVTAFTAANRSGVADPALVTELEARYRANIVWIDHAVGELIDHLKQKGLYDEALLIVTSDHGEAFFKHKKFGHTTTMYEDMTHIPLIIKPPRSMGVRPAHEPTPVGTIDVPATVVSWFGAPIPATFQGDDLLPLIRGEISALPHPEVTSSTGNLALHSLRLGDHKLLVRGGYSELYNLAADPHEQQNLARTSPEKVAEMRTILESMVDLRKRTGTNPEQGHVEDEAEKKMLQTLGYVAE